MNASQTTRRTLASAGAGAIIAAGALVAGIATQPYPVLAEDATYDTVASDASYSDVAPGDGDTAAGDSAPTGDTQQDGQNTADAGTQGAPTFSAVASAPAATASKSCLALSVPGSFDTTQAQALLARINEIRAEAAAEGLVDYESGVTVTGAPLTWSTGLEQMAQTRAVESSYSFSHTRPDGSGTVLDTNGPLVAGANPTVLAENLAQASDTASALELWYAEKDAYERYLNGDTSVSEGDFGHYAALISDDYTYVGLGSFIAADGDTYLAGEFSNAASDSAAVQPDGACVAQINAETAGFAASIATPQDWDGSLTAGQTLQLGLNLTGTQGGTYAAAEQLTWTSSDESVVTVDGNGLVSAVGSGPATVSVSAADGAEPLASIDLAVAAQQVSTPNVTGMTFEDARAALEAAGLVAGDALTGEEASDPSMNGVVYAQDPTGDTLVDAGMQVTLTAYADYVAPWATSCEAAEPVETEAGVAPELPATVTVYWSKGDPTQEAVTWDDVDPALYADGGSFQVSGTVGDTGLTTTVDVAVKAKPAPTIVSLEDVNVTTPCGTAPELPETVSATMSDDTTSTVNVTWNAVDASQYSSRAGGTFDVTGTVEGAAGYAVAHVTVTPATITALEDPEPITTFVGHEPTLPTTVKATWSNGDVTDEPVEWQPLLGLTQDGKGPWDFAGDVTLTGTVEGTDETVSLTVSVVEPGVQSVGELASVSTLAGVAPKLPETVQVTWEDGSTTQESITWDAIDPASYDKAGIFTVTGTVPSAGDARVGVQVTVTAADLTIVSVAPIADVTTPSGTAPTLPGQVEVTWSDNSTNTGTIAWDAVDEASYKVRAGGEFSVHGTVSATPGSGEGAANATADVSVRVIVSPATATAVEQPAGVSTTAKTAPTLPATARVTWSNGDVTDEAVTWDAINPSFYENAGTFTASGKVSSTGQGVSCKVTVKAAAAAATAVSAKAVDITTTAGVAPQLPASVEVTWSDGTATKEVISWNAVSASAYAQAGSFDVTGSIATAPGLQATAHVTVTALTAVRAVLDNSVISTTEGVAPTLPTTARVTWSNGKTTTETISWNAVDPALYAKAGTFDVKGTAAGVAVTAHVNVTGAEVAKTADPSPSPVLAAMLASGGVLAAAAGVVLKLRVKRG